jgi:hypothetical protein
MGAAGFGCTAWSWSLLCWEKTSERCSVQIVQNFPSHFLPMVPEVLNVCVMGVMLFWAFSYFFYRFHNRIIFPFKIRNVFFKLFIPHFLEFGFKFVAYSVIFVFFCCWVCEFFARLNWLFSFRLLVS